MRQVRHLHPLFLPNRFQKPFFCGNARSTANPDKRQTTISFFATHTVSVRIPRYIYNIIYIYLYIYIYYIIIINIEILLSLGASTRPREDTCNIVFTNCRLSFVDMVMSKRKGVFVREIPYLKYSV